MTLNHNLGALPSYIQAFVRVKSGTNAGYMFEINSGIITDTNGRSSGVTYTYDENKVYFEKPPGVAGVSGPVCVGKSQYSQFFYHQYSDTYTSYLVISIYFPILLLLLQKHK